MGTLRIIAIALFLLITTGFIMYFISSNSTRSKAAPTCSEFIDRVCATNRVCGVGGICYKASEDVVGKCICAN